MALKADGQTSFFKLMSKDYHGEVAKFSELVWFRFLAMQPKLAEHWREQFTGLESRNDLMNICSRSDVSLVQPERLGEHHMMNSGIWSVDAVLVSSWELRVRSEFDAPLTRQKYIITNQMLDQHGRTLLCTRCSLGTGSHSSDCRARFESIWTKELAEAEVPIRVEAEVANRAVDAVPIDPNARVSEPGEPAAAADGQPAAMEANTDPVVERAGKQRLSRT